MNIDHLGLATDVAGRGFPLPEQAAIQAATVKLLLDSSLTEAQLWGKVFGQRADYTVLLAHSGDPFGKDALVFVSTDAGISFSSLAIPTADTLAREAPSQVDAEAAAKPAVVPVTVLDLFARTSRSGRLAGPLIGDPAFEYRVRDAFSGKVFVMKESERLACFISLQLRVGRVIPRGAYLRRDADVPASIKGRVTAAAATGAELFTVRRNAAFAGLDVPSAGRLASYVHLRKEARQRLSLELEGAATNLDWLDPISDDEPAGCWAVQYKPAGGLVVGTSLELLGSSFYHVPETDVFGSLYMGDANVNRDLPFMM